MSAPVHASRLLSASWRSPLQFDLLASQADSGAPDRSYLRCDSGQFIPQNEDYTNTASASGLSGLGRDAAVRRELSPDAQAAQQQQQQRNAERRQRQLIQLNLRLQA